MSERTYAAAGWIATASVNLFALAQSESVLNAASGVTIVGGSMVGLYFLFKHKQLEIQKKEHEQNLQAEKDRQALLAGSLTGKLEVATIKIENLTDLLSLKDRENTSLKAMLEQFEERITKNEGKKRHDVVDRFTGEFSKLQLDAIEKDAEIAKLRRELEKTKGVVNNNADATKQVAEGANSDEINVAHIDDTSGDLPTLTG